MAVIKEGKHTWENVGREGSHGTFSSKAGAERQKAAMFANGYKGHAEGGEIMNGTNAQCPMCGDTHPVGSTCSVGMADGGDVENVRQQGTFGIKAARTADSTYHPNAVKDAKNRAKQSYLDLDRTEEQKQARSNANAEGNSPLRGWADGGEVHDEMRAEDVRLESTDGMKPRGIAAHEDSDATIGMEEDEDYIPRFANGGYIDGTYFHDKDIDMPEEDEHLDRVLDEVVAMTEDPDNDVEIEHAIDASEESPGDKEPTLDRIKEIESDPAPEEFDEVERMAHDMSREEDARKPRSYGMRRGGMARC